MVIRSLEELLVYQRALSAADEILAILDRPAFLRDPELRKQLGASSERVPALISEGFAQGTDRHFASYLYRARGSSSETRTHLQRAQRKGCITSDEWRARSDRYTEIEKMLTGLIKHLNRENRQRRG